MKREKEWFEVGEREKNQRVKEKKKKREIARSGEGERRCSDGQIGTARRRGAASGAHDGCWRRGRAAAAVGRRRAGSAEGLLDSATARWRRQQRGSSERWRSWPATELAERVAAGDGAQGAAKRRKQRRRSAAAAGSARGCGGGRRESTSSGRRRDSGGWQRGLRRGSAGGGGRRRR
ncbi:hypothetical protein Syun_029930 [Stephania yunnanensis]|uniref:Uncharacterized protein n=1 Tax=Stephania yunnanensis TaxID=152371 RepID=A0AAP0E6J5_9MAGN